MTSLGRCLRTAPDPDGLAAKLQAAHLYGLAYAVIVLGLVPMQPGPAQVVETWIRR